MRTVWLALVVGTLACGHARATPAPHESSPTKVPMQSIAVPADETHAPAPVDAQTMPPISRVFDNVVFSILLPANTEVVQGWTGYFLADGKKIPNTDFKIEKVVGRGAKGSIAAGKLPAPNKLPSSDVRLFSPRVEH
ncbi:MAG: hypothetical protein ABI704_05725 [Kofleriaceae bacterium]